MATWGRVRPTTDADFAVSLDLMAAPELDAAMKGAGFDKESGPQEIPGRRMILSKYWAPGPAVAPMEGETSNGNGETCVQLLRLPGAS